MILVDNFQENLDFSGKTALVTGSAKGIGKAIAEMFARFKADIVLFDVDEDEGNKTALGIREHYGVTASFFTVDLKDTDSIRSAVASALALTPVDILVNNAGIGVLQAAESCSEDIWDMTFAINTKAVFFLSQEIGRLMIKRGYGKIVNMASQAGVISLQNHTVYAATKAAVISLTKSLAYEWARHGISVNSISPTIVLTELGKMNWEGPHGDEMKARIPNGRFAMPDEVAYLAAYLASDGAAMINGENIMMDGGYSIY